MMEEGAGAGEREGETMEAQAAASSCDDGESDVPSPRRKRETGDGDSGPAARDAERPATPDDATNAGSNRDTKTSRALSTAEAKRLQPMTEPGIDARFHALAADDLDDGAGAGNYQIVKKSIYKPHRKGFLSRLTGGASVTSTKQKYAFSDITGISIGEEADAASPSPTKLEEKQVPNDIDLTIDEEEGIEVAIDRIAKTPRGARPTREQRRLNAEDAALGGPAEVVIHSGDNEAGFATLNPILGSNVPLRAPSHGASAAPAMTKSTGVSVAKASPVLLEIPVAEQASVLGRDRLLLIINALGATGLPKAEKFGTQSCFLEMRLFDSLNAKSSSGSSYLMRTELHKKGGSEAQWNQQFTTTLRSKDTQFLHLEVKTSSKTLVGEANVTLDKVGDLFYDQHYPLFRSDDTSESSNDPGLLPAGQVHLQLKIVDTASLPLPATVIPPLQLPIFSGLENVHPSAEKPLSAKAIPTVLLNGGLFFKIPYHTHNIVGRTIGPRRQWVAVRRVADPPHLQITWGDPTHSGSADRNNARTLDLAQVIEIREGHGTDAFSAQTESNVVKEKDKCFSLVTRGRTLDLVAASKEDAHIWVSSLRDLLFASDPSMDSSVMSARTIEDFKQFALSPREQIVHSSGNRSAAVPPTKRMIAVWRNRIFNLARHDRLDDIMECLEDGCPIDLLESGTGDTLLMVACRLGNAELVELCLSRRAKNDPHPEFGETALQVAVNCSHAHCVGLLLSTAAKSDMDSEIVNHIDPNNDAPLHVAARHGDLACLQLLLHHGADICVVEEFGRTPLHCAVANGNLDCVAYLLDVGGDSVLNSGDHDGDTALHYAALSGNEAIVRLLLESAANVFATNIHKETAYDIAVREKQQRCAELIAKYFLTNEKEPCVPISRNEPASALLGRPKRDHSPIVFTDNGKVVDEVIEEHIPSAFVHPEAWKPVQIKQANSYEDELEIYPVNHGPSSGNDVTSRLPLSPSEQIRDALTRKHRSNSLSPCGYTPPWTGNSIYSARELPSYTASHSYEERLVATERLNREHTRPFERYPLRGNDSPFSERHKQRLNYYHDGYPSQYEVRTQMQARPEYAQPIETYWPTIRPNSREMGSPTAWSHYKQGATNAFTQQTLHHRAESQWETLYTDEGYAYYVNRITGVSQWEKPADENVNTSFIAPDTLSDAKPDSLAPDAIIRMRLAEVRKQKSQTALVSPVSSLATSCSTPTLICQSEVCSSEPVRQDSIKRSAIEVTSELPAQELPIERDSIKPGLVQQQPVAAPETSKYEARTGFKLTVDTAAPPAQDGTFLVGSLTVC
ncbi:unnamed protein product [Phytophthora fragariaefolia]|uniref:Unnamed protein product n=1 Tax=Phytophthora fragariaefolia TaxID=1490495 RepID=A0A9W7CVW0_9STRA|nr:unnamed protein product [Phytophthora fragariaefolia]